MILRRRRPRRARRRRLDPRAGAHAPTFSGGLAVDRFPRKPAHRHRGSSFPGALALRRGAGRALHRHDEPAREAERALRRGEPTAAGWRARLAPTRARLRGRRGPVAPVHPWPLRLRGGACTDATHAPQRIRRACARATASPRRRALLPIRRRACWRVGASGVSRGTPGSPPRRLPRGACSCGGQSPAASRGCDRGGSSPRSSPGS
jgi:hypothetical protein